MKNYFFKNSQDGIENSVISLLQILGVKVTETTVKNTLKSHPNYPSMLSISDAFNQWNVDTLALRIPPEKLAELPSPFIAHTNGHSTSFVVVKEIAPDHITYIDDKKKKNQLLPADFYKMWDGNVLAVESFPNSGEKNYESNLRKEWWNNMRIPLVAGGLILIGILQALYFFFGPAINQFDRILFTGLWVCNVLGIVVSALLLWYEYDENNPNLKKICSISTKTNCSAILNSNASKVFKNITWSEIGYVYFTGAFLYMSIAINSSNFFTPLLIINLLAVPYILFSVFYQGVIAKQWCILCLMVQTLLLAEFLVALFTRHINGSMFSNLTDINFGALLLAYFVPVAIWVIAKPYIYRAKEGKQLQYNLVKFKNNPEIFNGLLKRETQMKSDPSALGIAIGNPDAQNVLVKVCNPYCGPCANAHPKIEKLIRENKNWQVRIIFINYREGDQGLLPVKHLLGIASINDREATCKALDDWYNAKEKNYDVFAAKYPLNGVFEQQSPKIEAMHAWCENEKIEHTPTIYVNGFRLPEQYDIDDLHFL